MELRDRFPPLAPEALTEAQRRASDAIASGPRGGVYGPFVPLLRSPELMDCAQRMGEYLRYRNAVGTTLSELAILVIARFWNQQVEWAIHAPIAARAGIGKSTIAAIAAGHRPTSLTADEAVVYDFCTELQTAKAISDATFGRALARLGEQGVVDLLGVSGYYTFLAMVMNGAQTAPPPSEASPLPDLGESRGAKGPP